MIHHRALFAALPVEQGVSRQAADGPGFELCSLHSAVLAGIRNPGAGHRAEPVRRCKGFFGASSRNLPIPSLGTSLPPVQASPLTVNPAFTPPHKSSLNPISLAPVPRLFL